MYLLDRLLILVAYVDNLQNVVVGMKCSRTDVDLYIVLQERYCQRLHFLRPSGTPHQSLTVRLFTTNKQPACTVSQLCVALILKSFVQFSGYFFTFFAHTHTYIHTYTTDRFIDGYNDGQTVQFWMSRFCCTDQKAMTCC